MLRRCLQGSSLLSLCRGWLGLAGSSAHGMHSLAQMSTCAGLNQWVQHAVRCLVQASRQQEPFRFVDEFQLHTSLLKTGSAQGPWTVLQQRCWSLSKTPADLVVSSGLDQRASLEPCSLNCPRCMQAPGGQQGLHINMPPHAGKTTNAC